MAKYGGGLSGLRDEGLLISAIERPKNLHYYQGIDDIVVLAACYACSLIQNHPFLDGNKRIGWITCALFLLENQVTIEAKAEDIENVCVGIADHSVTEEEFIDWIHRHVSSA